MPAFSSPGRRDAIIAVGIALACAVPVWFYVASIDHTPDRAATDDAATAGLPPAVLVSFADYEAREPAELKAKRIAANQVLQTDPKNEPAFQILRDGCTDGDAISCGGRGASAQALGWFVRAQDPRWMLRRECELGLAIGCADYATLLTTGEASAQDIAQGRKLAQAICDAKEPRGCDVLGASLARDANGDAAALARALTLYLQSCSMGFSEACIDAGIVYENGRGTAKSQAKALPLYEKACDAGVALACYGAGWALDANNDLPRDPKRAAKFYERACPGYPMACTNLGSLYDDGGAMKKDPVRGAALHAQSCELGCAVGCFDEAESNAKGRGVKKDPARARTLYAKACPTVIEGCMPFGKMAQAGRGGPVDEAAAQTAYGQACEKGIDDACEKIAANPTLDPLPGDKPACDAGKGRPCLRLAFAMIEKIESARKARGLGQRPGESEQEFDVRMVGKAEDDAKHGRFDLDGADELLEMTKAEELIKKACKLGDYAACKTAGKL